MGWIPHVTRRLYELSVGFGDFTGLKQPTDSVLLRTWELIVDLFEADTPTPNIVPTEDGNISLIWHRSGWEIDIEVGEESEEFWARRLSTDEIVSGLVDELRPRIVSILRELK